MELRMGHLGPFSHWELEWRGSFMWASLGVPSVRGETLEGGWRLGDLEWYHPKIVRWQRISKILRLGVAQLPCL